MEFFSTFVLPEEFLASETRHPLTERVLRMQLRELFNGIDDNCEDQIIFNYCIKSIVKISSRFDSDFESALNDIKILAEKLLSVKRSCEKPLYSNDQMLFLVFYTIFGIFLKENCIGRSFLWVDADKKFNKQEKEKLKVEKQPPNRYDFEHASQMLNAFDKEFHQDLHDFGYRFIKTENFIRMCPDGLRKSLSLEGEIWHREYRFSQLFASSLALIEALCSHDKQNQFASLYYARISFLHNKILRNPIEKHQTIVCGIYRQLCEEDGFIGTLPTPEQSLLKVEHGNILIFYYKYQNSLLAYLKAQELLKLKVSLTGKEGVRTKFQTFKTAQLVAQARTEEQEEQLESDGKPLPNPLHLVKENLPKDVQLDEECILYETPKIEEPDEEVKTKELDVYSQIAILGLMKHMLKSYPNDEIMREHISAYLGIVLEHSKNWLVYSNSLLVRSLNEFPKYKKKERAILQIESLVEQHNDRQPEFYDRVRFLYALNYPDYINLQKNLAEKYMEMGCVLSSCEIFERLGMQDECVECLAAAGHIGRAKELAQQLLDKEETPKLLCIFGDLTGELEYYKRAWKKSEKRFARAKRSLAYAYFHQGNFQKSINAYQKAVGINRYHSSSWFTLGCAYLKVKDFQNAVTSFSQVVTIDESQGEAWANLSAAFSSMGKKTEALSTLEQAVKYCENSWRMWHNYMIIALESRKFSKFLEAMQKLVFLQQRDLVSEEVIRKANLIMRYHLDMREELSKKNVEFMKNRIDRVFKSLCENMGERSYVWDCYADYLLITIEFHKYIAEYKVRLIIEDARQNQGAKVKFVEESPEYQIEKEKNSLVKKVLETKKKSRESRLKACQTLMKTGWEICKVSCEGLLVQGQKLAESYNGSAATEDEKKELKGFLDSIRPRLEECLERQVELKADI